MNISCCCLYGNTTLGCWNNLDLGFILQSLNKMCALMKIYETELGLCSGEDPMWLELIAIREETNRCKAALLVSTFLRPFLM